MANSKRSPDVKNDQIATKRSESGKSAYMNIMFIRDTHLIQITTIIPLYILTSVTLTGQEIEDVRRRLLEQEL